MWGVHYYSYGIIYYEPVISQDIKAIFFNNQSITRMKIKLEIDITRPEGGNCSEYEILRDALLFYIKDRRKYISDINTSIINDKPLDIELNQEIINSWELDVSTLDSLWDALENSMNQH